MPTSAELFVSGLTQRLKIIQSLLPEDDDIRVQTYLYDGRILIVFQIEYQEPDIVVFSGVDPATGDEMIVLIPYSQQPQVMILFVPRKENKFPRRKMGFGQK